MKDLECTIKIRVKRKCLATWGKRNEPKEKSSWRDKRRIKEEGKHVPQGEHHAGKVRKTKNRTRRRTKAGGGITNRKGQCPR